MMRRTIGSSWKQIGASLLHARILTALLVTLLVAVLWIEHPVAAFGGGSDPADSAIPPADEDSVLEEDGDANGEQQFTMGGLGTVPRPLAAVTHTVLLTGASSSPTSVELVLFGEGPDITTSWWWASWPWLMGLVTALSLVGVLLVRKRWLTNRV